MKTNELVMADCRGQAYDGAAAMSSDRCSAQAEVRKEAPNTAYTHCQSHVINLAIVAACKNQSISNMMDAISSVNPFYEFSPKRKWYFEKFLNFYGEEIGLTEVHSLGETSSCIRVILFALLCQCCSDGVYLQVPTL